MHTIIHHVKFKLYILTKQHYSSSLAVYVLKIHHKWRLMFRRHYKGKLKIEPPFPKIRVRAFEVGGAHGIL